VSKIPIYRDAPDIYVGGRPPGLPLNSSARQISTSAGSNATPNLRLMIKFRKQKKSSYYVIKASMRQKRGYLS